MDAVKLASMIDQTMLRPTVGLAEGTRWIDDNREQGFAALCVSPFLVPAATEALAGARTRVCSVVAFPLGIAASRAKAVEARHLVELGCREIDMVMNVGALLEGDDTFVRRDIEAVVAEVSQASEGTGIVKVILETGYLDPADIARACHLAAQAGADFVKSSTGFGPRGASVEDIEIMRTAVGPDVGVKAAGGIRDLASAMAMIEAGASRVGTSAGQAILAEAATGGHAPDSETAQRR